MRKVLTLAAAVLAMSAGGAGAEPQVGQGDRWERTLQRLDTNKDGAIGQDEARDAGEQRFARLDANGDGVLSQSEFTALPQGREIDAEQVEKVKAWRQKAFETMSAGNPQGITREAYLARAGQRFQTVDADKDGRITRDEVKAAKQRMRQDQTQEKDPG